MPNGQLPLPMPLPLPGVLPMPSSWQPPLLAAPAPDEYVATRITATRVIAPEPTRATQLLCRAPYQLVYDIIGQQKCVYEPPAPLSFPVALQPQLPGMPPLLPGPLLPGPLPLPAPSPLIQLLPFPLATPAPSDVTPTPLLTAPSCPEGGSWDIEMGACVMAPSYPLESSYPPDELEALTQQTVLLPELPSLCPQGTVLDPGPPPICKPCPEGMSWQSSPPFNTCVVAPEAPGKPLWPWLLGGAVVVALGGGALYLARRS